MDVFVRIINPILMILLGLGVGIIVSKLRNVEWKLYGIGAITFVGSQILHIPFNIWVLNPFLQSLPPDSQHENGHLLIVAISLGLSAGIFEETARYLVYRFWMKDVRKWKEALMFGAGHGGIEAILLGIFTLFSVINIIVLADQDLSTVVPAEQLSLAQAQIAAFWEAPWYEVLLGAGERLFALSFHLSAAVLVLQVFRREGIQWLFGAMGLHAILNGLAVYVSQIWGIYATEGVLAIFSLFCIGIIFWLKTEDPPEEESENQPYSLIELQREDTTAKQIEESKYAQ